MPAERWSLRRAALADAPYIAVLVAAAIEGLTAKEYTPAQRAAWIGCVSSDYFRTLILLDQYDVWVATDDGRTLSGVGALHMDEVSYLYVHPRAARMGLGSLLLARLEQSALRRGVTRVHLRSSLTARPFYERRGFRVVRACMLRRGGVDIPCILMEKELVATDDR